MSSDIAPLRFLVVDDDQDMRDLLGEMVGQLGHSVDTACDGVEAVEALGVESYDFMLLDLTMPRMSGEDVLRWVADHRDWAIGMHVIVVSGRSGIHELDAEGLGVRGVLPKPFRSQQLRDMVSLAAS
jgi:CheY-like chemotaxis protein